MYSMLKYYDMIMWCSKLILFRKRFFVILIKILYKKIEWSSFEQEILENCLACLTIKMKHSIGKLTLNQNKTFKNPSKLLIIKKHWMFFTNFQLVNSLNNSNKFLIIKKNWKSKQILNLQKSVETKQTLSPQKALKNKQTFNQ
jgi:hypothetical protein